MFSSPVPKAYQWVASLYFFQSLPFVVVSLIAAIMYQQHGLSNAQSAFITSLLVLPWALKPLFSPFLEQFLTRKQLTILMQLFVSIIFFILALSVKEKYFLLISLCGFAGLAFASSIHDIVSDGVYLINLDVYTQKRYIALRSLCYQMGRLFIKGGLLVIVGYWAIYYHINLWATFFYCLSLLGLLLTLYHYYQIPEVERSCLPRKVKYPVILKSVLSVPQFYSVLFFIFIYNFSEAQMQKVVPLFLLDKMGLNFKLFQVGEIYGIAGSLALMLGIFISGVLITRFDLGNCLTKSTFFLWFAHLFFFFLVDGKNTQPIVVEVAILFSQFAFGLANGAYMGYLLFVAYRSCYPMTMYTICTATMALGYVFFGALSGLIQQWLGYSGFFLYIFCGNILIIVLTYRVISKHG